MWTLTLLASRFDTVSDGDVTLLRMNDIFQKISEAVADTMASKQAEIDGVRLFFVGGPETSRRGCEQQGEELLDPAKAG